MRIFVTGASGWIGSAVVPELLGAGTRWSAWPAPRHRRSGSRRPARSSSKATSTTPTAWQGGADSDGVIHLAFQHEVAFAGNFAAAAGADRRAVEAMGAALADSDRPFVLASGILGLTAGRVATEDDGLVPSAEVRANPAGRRSATALLALSLRA